MKRCLSICVCFAGMILSAGEVSRIDAARRALGDGLWDVAANVAAKAAAEANDDKSRNDARLTELEALAGAGRAADVLRRLEKYSDADADGFRYWRAWANLETGKTDEARHLLARSFSTPVYQVLSLRLSARAAVMAGDRASAVSFFEKSAAALGSNSCERAENAVEWAQALVRFGDVAAARDRLAAEGAIGVTGAAGDAARLLSARLALRLGDAGNGRSLLESLVSNGVKTDAGAYVRAACMLSDIHFSAGAANDALRMASNAVARAVNPESERLAGFSLGFLLLSDALTRDSGHEMISALVRKYPGEAESGEAQLRLADSLLSVGDYAESVREYEVLLQAYPEHALNAHVLEGRGLALSRLGRHAEAVGMLARAAQVTTNDEVRARCVFEQAEAMVATGRFKEAAATYAAVGKGTLHSEARFRQADALRRDNRAQEALDIFRALIKEGGENVVECVLRVAHLEVARGHVEQAISDYGMLLGDKPVRAPTPEQRVRALSGRGRALYRAYRFREADADFAAVAKLQPSRGDEMGFLSALCLYGDGRDREAYASARTLLLRVPDSLLRCDLQFWVARYEAERHEWSSAIEGFEKCSTNAHLSVARRFDAIVRAARCAAAISDYPKVVELTGRIAARTDPVEADAGRMTPELSSLSEALVLQGEALKELARFDEAVLVFERAARLNGEEKFRRRAEISRADCLFAMGADDAKYYQNALEAYRTLLQSEKLNASVRLEISFKVGRTCEKLRRFEEAAEEYYTHVVLVYWNAVHAGDGESSPKVLFDGAARAFFARAAFVLADYYESRGELRQAVQMLKYLVAARVPSAEEAQRRIRRITERSGY